MNFSTRKINYIISSVIFLFITVGFFYFLSITFIKNNKSGHNLNDLANYKYYQTQKVHTTLNTLSNISKVVTTIPKFQNLLTKIQSVKKYTGQLEKINKNITFVVKKQEELSSTTKKEREGIYIFLKKWILAWEGTEIEKYFKHYSNEFRTTHLTFKEWAQDKIKKNLQNTKRKITIGDPVILKQENTFVVEFKQHFASSNYEDLGNKILYIIKEKDEYKIVKEIWRQIKKKRRL